MKQLEQKLEDFFSAFDSDEAIDLSAQKCEIMELLSCLMSEYDHLTGKIKESQRLQEENEDLRRIITNDCRAKLILLGDGDADERVRCIAALPLEELKEKRLAILRRFDSKFILADSVGSTELSGSDSAVIDLQAFQS